MNLPETLLKSLAIATAVVGMTGCIPDAMRKPTAPKQTTQPTNAVVPAEPADPLECRPDSCPACGRG